MPDLQCVIEEQPRLFELGEILESNLAKGVKHSGRQAEKKMDAIARGDHAAAKAIQTAGFRSFSANASLDRVLRRKLSKTYKTNGLPCDLLLFYGQQKPWGPFDYLLGWRKELAKLIAESVFQKVWIFSLPLATLIGYLEAGLMRVFERSLIGTFTSTQPHRLKPSHREAQTNQRRSSALFLWPRARSHANRSGSISNTSPGNEHTGRTQVPWRPIFIGF